MELQTRRKERNKSEIFTWGKRIVRFVFLGIVTVAGSLAILAIVLGILFFSGETTEFIYMDF
ncbi:hypothetical protein [Paenibacillus sp. DMB20]|uniref:hypothetical protein n=1 Tax=Paenibacillus sp. DMB20 TaxID=1642570 RepID=UPI0006281FBF|nr:hypothetical protein [Paenibacillus sp. DMB20]KKO52519.1 hypothetical protein XI25_20405 [Paenibacillus sp. DMB20]